jgi:hypothetical protein
VSRTGFFSRASYRTASPNARLSTVLACLAKLQLLFMARRLMNWSTLLTVISRSAYPSKTGITSCRTPTTSGSRAELSPDDIQRRLC